MTATQEALLIRQAPGIGLDGLSGQLTDAFALARSALVASRPVVVVVDDRDLLGQGRVEDAALASAMLGLTRALALEGARDGWVVNAIALGNDSDQLDSAREWLERPGAPTGQLVRLGSGHLGRVWP